MMRLKSDLVALCNAALDKELDTLDTEWDPRPSLGVVLAAGGYPASYNKGDIITGLPVETPDSKVFHAGTTEKDGQIVTNGGRVLCAVALGSTVAEAQKKAYQLVEQIHWDGVYYRHDIGYRAIARDNA